MLRIKWPVIFIKKVEDRCVNINLVPFMRCYDPFLGVRKQKFTLTIVSPQSAGNKCVSSDTAYDYWKLREKINIQHSPKLKRALWLHLMNFAAYVWAPQLYVRSCMKKYKGCNIIFAVCYCNILMLHAFRRWRLTSFLLRMMSSFTEWWWW